VILPESGIGQADQLYRRVQAAVSERPIGHVPRLDRLYEARRPNGSVQPGSEEEQQALARIDELRTEERDRERKKAGRGQNIAIERIEDGQVCCRVYGAAGKLATATASVHGLTMAGLRAATGEEMQTLQPFQIGELRFKPTI
jgi:hypothetical protein